MGENNTLKECEKCFMRNNVQNNEKQTNENRKIKVFGKGGGGSSHMIGSLF